MCSPHLRLRAQHLCELPQNLIQRFPSPQSRQMQRNHCLSPKPPTPLHQQHTHTGSRARPCPRVARISHVNKRAKTRHRGGGERCCTNAHQHVKLNLVSQIPDISNFCLIPCFSIWGSRGKWCKGKDVLEYHKYQSSKNIPLKVYGNYKYDRNGGASEKDVIVDDPCLVSPFLPRRAGEGAKAGNQYKYS